MTGQGKNIGNTTKNSTTQVKSNGPTVARLEQPNIYEAEENDLKITLG